MEAAKRILAHSALKAARVSKAEQAAFAQELINRVPKLKNYLRLQFTISPHFRYPEGLHPQVLRSLKKLGWSFDKRKDLFVRPDGMWPLPIKKVIDHYILEIPVDDGLNVQDFVERHAAMWLPRGWEYTNGEAVLQLAQKEESKAKANAEALVQSLQKHGFKVERTESITSKSYGAVHYGKRFILVQPNWEVQVSYETEGFSHYMRALLIYEPSRV